MEYEARLAVCSRMLVSEMANQVLVVLEQKPHQPTPTWLSRRSCEQAVAGADTATADSWSAAAAAQTFHDASVAAAGDTLWPPRSYRCNFCPRVFRTAQALGGHMNVHRRERAFVNEMAHLSSDEADSLFPMRGRMADAPAPPAGLVPPCGIGLQREPGGYGPEVAPPPPLCPHEEHSQGCLRRAAELGGGGYQPGLGPKANCGFEPSDAGSSSSLCWLFSLPPPGSPQQRSRSFRSLLMHKQAAAAKPHPPALAVSKPPPLPRRQRFLKQPQVHRNQSTYSQESASVSDTVGKGATSAAAQYKSREKLDLELRL